jgi:hypothetical protein
MAVSPEVLVIARTLADLTDQITALARSAQLPSSTVGSGDDTVVISTAVVQATTAMQQIPDLYDVLADNAQALADAQDQVDAALDAAQEASDAGVAAGELAQAAADEANTNAQTAIENAANAQQAAADAQTAAEDANTTADGKNQITYSTSAPDNTQNPGTHDGDLWFVYVSNTQIVVGMYLWSAASSTWVQQTLNNEVIATLDAGKIVTGYLSADRIQAQTITGAKIAAGTITGALIAGSTITGDLVAANTLTAANLKAATITGNEIAAGTVAAANIKANTIGAGQIAALSIGTGQLAANAVTTDKLAANSVTANTIAAGAIDGTTITGATLRTSTPGNTRTETTSQGFAFFIGDGSTGAADARVGVMQAGTRFNSYTVDIGMTAADNPDVGGEYQVHVGPVQSVLSAKKSVSLHSDYGGSFGYHLFSDALWSYNSGNGDTPLAGIGAMPGMYARAQSNQTVATATTQTLAFNNPQLQNGLTSYASTDGGTGFIVPYTGWYALSVSVNHSTTASTTARHLAIYSGNTLLQDQTVDSASAAAIANGGVFFLAAGNQMTFRFTQTTGSPLTVQVQQAGIRYLGPQ